MIGSGRSPDTLRWLNARALYFDQLRQQMAEGSLDIDFDDEKLLDEMLMIKYKFSPKGAIQIESKDDMRSRGIKSPDNLDAAVYAAADISNLLATPGMGIGDMVVLDPWEMLDLDQRRGMPI
jgi:hypothetical protein